MEDLDKIIKEAVLESIASFRINISQIEINRIAFSVAKWIRSQGALIDDENIYDSIIRSKSAEEARNLLEGSVDTLSDQIAEAVKKELAFNE